LEGFEKIVKCNQASAMTTSMGGVLVVVLLLWSLMGNSDAFDYSDALEKSLMFYEGQRSGALPDDQRMLWRGNSALNDGSESGVRIEFAHSLSWLK